jgi:hypothetical protein
MGHGETGEVQSDLSGHFQNAVDAAMVFNLTTVSTFDTLCIIYPVFQHSTLRSDISVAFLKMQSSHNKSEVLLIANVFSKGKSMFVIQFRQRWQWRRLE